LAPTLPGHHHPGEDRAEIGHDDLVAAALATLEAAGPDPLVLVGHSLGGAVISQVADRRPDRSLPLPWELWRGSFMQTADEAAAQAAFGRLVPVPSRTTFDPVRLPRLAGLDLPATFVCFRQDQTMPQGYWHPGMSGRLPGAAVVEIDGDHEAMLTAPGRLADALHQVAGFAEPAAAHRPEATADA